MPRVSPELVLVDPALAATERALLPDPPPSLRTPTLRIPTGDPRGERNALQALATAALGIEELDSPEVARSRRTWPRFAAAAVVTALALLLLDVRVDVGRTPAAAERSEPSPRAELLPGVRAAPSQVDAGRDEQSAAKQPVGTRSSARTAVPRRFSWAPLPGAEAYEFELFRKDSRVFVGSSQRAELTLPPRWAFAGNRQTLTAGEYRWYVWPITSGKRAPAAIVQATLRVS
jgi:hypothetical protein